MVTWKSFLIQFMVWAAGGLNFGQVSENWPKNADFQTMNYNFFIFILGTNFYWKTTRNLFDKSFSKFSFFCLFWFFCKNFEIFFDIWGINSTKLVKGIHFWHDFLKIFSFGHFLYPIFTKRLLRMQKKKK